METTKKKKLRKWTKKQIKMLSTLDDKEIARLTNRSVGSISVARSYYKKKGMVSVAAKQGNLLSKSKGGGIENLHEDRSVDVADHKINGNPFKVEKLGVPAYRRFKDPMVVFLSRVMDSMQVERDMGIKIGLDIAKTAKDAKKLFDSAKKTLKENEENKEKKYLYNSIIDDNGKYKNSRIYRIN